MAYWLSLNSVCKVREFSGNPQLFSRLCLLAHIKVNSLVSILSTKSSPAPAAADTPPRQSIARETIGSMNWLSRSRRSYQAEAWQRVPYLGGGRDSGNGRWQHPHPNQTPTSTWKLLMCWKCQPELSLDSEARSEIHALLEAATDSSAPPL